MTLRLTALDLASDVGWTLDWAPRAERLGFARYWLTEHLPQANVELIATAAAGSTRTIRVGAAGVLLNLRSPAQTAQNFLLLDYLFPGRIDAGFCAGGASPDRVRAFSELETIDRDRYVERAESFVALLRGGAVTAPRFDSELVRYSQESPEIWSHGTGPASAELAARNGLALGYSLFHASSRDDPGPMRRYRERFCPATRGLQAPLTCLALAGIVSETEERARSQRRGHRNELIVPTLVGSPDQCRDQVAEYLERYRADEVAFLDVSPTYADKRRSYTLFYEACRRLAGVGDPVSRAADSPVSALRRNAI